MRDLCRKNPDFVFRRIADESILVPVSDSVADMESIFVLNVVAARAWDLIDGQRDIPQIADGIVQEFDVPLVRAEEDVRDLVSQLKAIKAVL